MKRAVFLAALAVGIVWNLRMGVADLTARRNTPEGTRSAMRWMPANGAYAAQMAEEIYASDPAQAKLLLQKALKLNRFDGGSWVQLGLLEEAGNQLPQAERSLLQAASVDATFLPSWSLANFYFRHMSGDRFWFWARKAAQMAPDDATPLFRLAWYGAPDAGQMEDRLQIKRPAVDSQLVDFLIAQGNPTAVAQASAHLLASGDKSSLETLVNACDWLLAQKRPDLALTLWNGLAPRISYPPAGLNSPVTNGGFSRSPGSHGFDWHLMTVGGASSYWNDHPSVLGFEFSGEEPDAFTLMTQVVPLQAQKAYRLTVEYSATGVAPDSGLSWAVRDVRSDAVLARTASLSAAPGGRASVCFTTPQGDAFARLSLEYQRQPGTVRVEGKLALKNVRLSAGDCAEPEKLSSRG